MSCHEEQWDGQLQALLARGAIRGYGLLRRNTGACWASCGELSSELWRGCDRDQPTPLARQILELFTASTADHLDICSQKAIIVQRSENSVCAVSRGKHLGVTAHYLPSGILVTMFGKPNLPQTVVPLVEAACDLLRQP